MRRWVIILRESALSDRPEIMAVRSKTNLTEYRAHGWKVIGRSFLRPSWAGVQAALALYHYYNPRRLP